VNSTVFEATLLEVASLLPISTRVFAIILNTFSAISPDRLHSEPGEYLHGLRPKASFYRWLSLDVKFTLGREDLLATQAIN
jgi:hypothetical protein